MNETVTSVKEWKKFRRYDNGAECYGMCKSSFMKLVKEYKTGKTVLVNCEIFERYLEGFKTE